MVRSALWNIKPDSRGGGTLLSIMHMHYHATPDIPFAGKLMQIYNEFVLTVSRLNRDMNNSLAAVRPSMRKAGPHNSHGPIGTLK